jgi:predicted O-linked N-acetylglucosamine transferase (SPINDLY family)
MSDGADLRPPEGLLAQAVACHQGGQLAEAESLYRTVLANDPRNADALHYLGLLGLQTGHVAAAEELLASAAHLVPEEPVLLNNWGIALARLGRLGEARARFETAVDRGPGYADALVNLANVLADLGEHAAAEKRYREAIAIAPGSAEAHNNLGRMLLARKRLPEAVASFEAALRARPGHALAMNNLGNALREQGRLDEACRRYRDALGLRPDLVEAASNLLVALGADPALSAGELFSAHRDIAARFEQPMAAMAPTTFAPRLPGRLRVGYVSADFRAHAVSAFVTALLERHDRSKVEVTAYHNAFVGDEVTRHIRENVEHFVVVAGLTDPEFVQRVRNDGIDVLVDLSGHTAGNRLAAFARRAAPVQATWLGYINTTGLVAMDFRITDARVDPPGATERWHTETLVRLPASQWCYRPWPDSPAVAPPPCLAKGHVTFGSTANPAKLNAPVLETWARVLGRTDGARLLVHVPDDGDFRERLLAALRHAGIAAGRVAFFPRLPVVDYLRRYAEIDICLDTFPSAGATTTLDALWMGVPVVSLAGEGPSSRAGAGILGTLGLAQCLAASRDEYVDRAARLAADPQALAALRQSLRGRIEASPLRDEAAFARSMEDALMRMCESRGLVLRAGD